MANNKKIAEDVLAAVGGVENITSVLHCMTRLRFTLKDIDVPDTDTVRDIDGVVGAQISGGQYQVIIGNNVPKVYDELCGMTGLAHQAAIDENLDGTKEPLTLKGIGNSILNYVSGSVSPMIPLLMCAGIFKVIGSVVGPSMLNLLPATSDLVVLMDMVYNAAFYFMPIYLGYNAAKQIGVTPILGAFIGGILLEPTFMGLAAEGAPFSVYGIPCTPMAYSKTVLPILLTVFAMSIIEKGMKKNMPDALSTVFTPVLTVGITLPISLCVLAPIGSWIGTGIADILAAVGTSGGLVSIIGGGLVAALWTFFVVTGMHLPIIMILQTAFMETGVDTFLFVATTIRVWSMFGTEIGAWLRLHGKEKAQALNFMVASIVGGVGEPFIFGMMFRHSRLWLTQALGAFVSGVIALGLGVKMYVMSTSNFTSVLAFIGGSSENFIFALVASAVGGIVALVATYLFGFSKDELAAARKK